MIKEKLGSWGVWQNIWSVAKICSSHIYQNVADGVANAVLSQTLVVVRWESSCEQHLISAADAMISGVLHWGAASYASSLTAEHVPDSNSPSDPTFLNSSQNVLLCYEWVASNISVAARISGFPDNFLAFVSIAQNTFSDRSQWKLSQSPLAFIYQGVDYTKAFVQTSLACSSVTSDPGCLHAYTMNFIYFQHTIKDLFL